MTKIPLTVNKAQEKKSNINHFTDEHYNEISECVCATHTVLFKQFTLIT
jgi:hypothetical protein